MRRRRKKEVKRRNPIARVLPLFRPRVVRDRSKYARKGRQAQRERQGWRAEINREGWW